MITYARIFNRLYALKPNNIRQFMRRSNNVSAEANPTITRPRGPAFVLLKPIAFTAAICGCSFCGAAIAQYEFRNRGFLGRTKGYLSPKAGAVRQEINSWWNSLKPGHKVAIVTIFLNSLVFVTWRIPSLTPFMIRHFLSLPSRTRVPCLPMLLSCFSHSSLLHLGVNMYVLYSFSSFASYLLGPEQMIGLYLSAGAVSSLTSSMTRLATSTFVPSQGASGALLGVIAYCCVSRPDSQVQLLFIPLAAITALRCIMVIDAVGLVMRWRYIDHACHLGGALFGVWYAKYGEQLFTRHRRTVVANWIKVKSSLK